MVAPAAASLALNRRLEKLGKQYTYDIPDKVPEISRRSHDGPYETSVIHVDSFGNCILGVRCTDLPTLTSNLTLYSASGSDALITIPYVQDYVEVAKGTPLALRIGAFPMLAIRQGSFSKTWNLQVGSKVYIK